MDGEAKCPVMGGGLTRKATGNTANLHWWPNQLNLKVLNQNPREMDPMGADFNYAKAFEALDLAEVKADIIALMTDSKDWWPADYGHYGPFFIRMAWHSAGTYRIHDGRGGGRTGTQRFAPLNSWPDNGNLDKARRLLWPVKQKYGAALSWADLMILTGNCAIESMGGKTFGFAGGREDVWEPEEDIYWGPETEWLDDKRYSGERDLDDPLGAVQMGLIYVNPEGPNGTPDPVASGRDIRETFGRMAMNDEETVALVAGGHTFGKGHGAGDPSHVGAEPEGEALVAQGLGWLSSYESGKGVHTITSGIEGAWTPNPTQWDMGYFDVLFGYDWELTKSPAGANIWHAKDLKDDDHAPEVDGSDKKVPIMMTTADMAMRMDPIYEKISRDFHANPDKFADAFARAWFKLTHRDMGPKVRYVGSEVPDEVLIWQDPVPEGGAALSDADLATVKGAIADSGLSVGELVRTAWASAATYRRTDLRGGANGARVALAPQNGWAVNNPSELSSVLAKLTEVQAASSVAVSLADMIVIGGSVGIEMAAKAAGRDVTVPTTTGRTDATAEMTDADSFDVLEPKFDGFRNYNASNDPRSGEELLVERANFLGLTAPEMTVLVGGMRVLGGNAEGVSHGVLTDTVGTLDNAYFTNLLAQDITWAPSEAAGIYEAKDSAGALKWTGTAADLVFGSNSILRAQAEVYACDDSGDKFVADFVAAWAKVMDNDRFDL